MFKEQIEQAKRRPGSLLLLSENPWDRVLKDGQLYLSYVPSYVEKQIYARMLSAENNLRAFLSTNLGLEPTTFDWDSREGLQLLYAFQQPVRGKDIDQNSIQAHLAEYAPDLKKDSLYKKVCTLFLQQMQSVEAYLDMAPQKRGYNLQITGMVKEESSSALVQDMLTHGSHIKDHAMLVPKYKSWATINPGKVIQYDAPGYSISFVPAKDMEIEKTLLPKNTAFDAISLCAKFSFDRNDLKAIEKQRLIEEKQSHQFLYIPQVAKDALQMPKEHADLYKCLDASPALQLSIKKRFASKPHQPSVFALSKAAHKIANTVLSPYASKADFAKTKQKMETKLQRALVKALQTQKPVSFYKGSFCFQIESCTSKHLDNLCETRPFFGLWAQHHKHDLGKNSGFSEPSFRTLLQKANGKRELEIKFSLPRHHFPVFEKWEDKQSLEAWANLLGEHIDKFDPLTKTSFIHQFVAYFFQDTKLRKQKFSLNIEKEYFDLKAQAPVSERGFFKIVLETDYLQHMDKLWVDLNSFGIGVQFSNKQTFGRKHAHLPAKKPLKIPEGNLVIHGLTGISSWGEALNKFDQILKSGELMSSAQRRHQGSISHTMSPIGDLASGIDWGVPFTISPIPSYGKWIYFVLKRETLLRKDLFFSDRDFGGGKNRLPLYNQYAQSLGQESIFDAPDFGARQKHMYHLPAIHQAGELNEVWFSHSVRMDEVAALVVTRQGNLCKHVMQSLQNAFALGYISEIPKVFPFQGVGEEHGKNQELICPELNGVFRKVSEHVKNYKFLTPEHLKSGHTLSLIGPTPAPFSHHNLN